MEGNFDIHSGDDDDDDDDDDNNFDIEDPFFGRFRPIPPNVLTIESNLLDDTFTGASSKMRFTRIPEHEHLRFLVNPEIYLLINSFGIPYLRQLVFDSMYCKFKNTCAQTHTHTCVRACMRVPLFLPL